jgi:hypothetical protein
MTCSNAAWTERSAWAAGVAMDVAKFGVDECLCRGVNLYNCYSDIENSRIRYFTAGKLQDKAGTPFVSRYHVNKRSFRSHAQGNSSATLQKNAGMYTVVAFFVSSDPNFTNAQSAAVISSFAPGLPDFTPAGAEARKSRTRLGPPDTNGIDACRFGELTPMPRQHLEAVLHCLRRVAGPAALEGVSDARLLERYISSHDEGAFAALVRRYSRLVRSVCCRVLRHEHDTEDAFQATFLLFATYHSS